MLNMLNVCWDPPKKVLQTREMLNMLNVWWEIPPLKGANI